VNELDGVLLAPDNPVELMGQAERLIPKCLDEVGLEVALAISDGLSASAPITRPVEVPLDLQFR